MKKVNRGIVLFVIVAVIVAMGAGKMLWKAGYLSVAGTYHLTTRDYSINKYVSYIKDLYDNSLGEYLTYHNELIDINSFNLRVSGVTHIDEKDGLVKMKNDYLTYEFGNTKLSDDEINKSVNKINQLYLYVANKGIGFLYVACPLKGYNTEYPAGINNNVSDNCNKFYSSLGRAGIPSLIIQKEMEKENISEEEAFFITDHHWKPLTGFWAAKKILEILQDRTGMDYNKEYCDISNYNVKTYKDWYLGAEGRKVGRYFTRLGVDDIDLITPEFKTSFSEKKPLKNEICEGNFTKTLLDMDNISERDLFNNSPYEAYMGGIERFRIYQNNNPNNGKKALVIMDSFGLVVAPFLSLQFDTLYSVDIRTWLQEKQIDVFKTIDEYNPDYVVMLYRGVAGKDEFNY